MFLTYIYGIIRSVLIRLFYTDVEGYILGPRWAAVRHCRYDRPKLANRSNRLTRLKMATSFYVEFHVLPVPAWKHSSKSHKKARDHATTTKKQTKVGSLSWTPKAVHTTSDCIGGRRVYFWRRLWHHAVRLIHGGSQRHSVSRACVEVVPEST